MFTGSAWSSFSALPIFMPLLFTSGFFESIFWTIAPISFERSIELSGDSCNIRSELPSLRAGIKSLPIIGKNANANAETATASASAA